MRNDFATGESTQKVLRPHQTHGLDLLRNSIRQGHKRIMFKAPVSYGKTLIAATIVRNMQARNKRVWFVCDSITLIDQTVSSFYAEGVYGIGVIQADHQMTDFHKPIQICSVQTLRRRRKLPDKPEVMLVDEAHCKDEWLLTLLATEEWADVIVIGLSATPWSKSLGLHYSDLVMPISMEELTQRINPETGNPYMAPFRIYTPGYVEKLAPKIAKMRTVQTRYGSDYDESGQLELLDTPELVADIVQTWKEKSERRPTLGFFVNRAHAAKIQQRFVDAGIGWGYIDGYTDRAERNRIKERLDAGEIAGVASVDAMIKGIDWKIGCLIWGRITKSKILLVQGDGRGGRMNSWADCIARDSRILTDRGVVKIQDITLDHKVWDGLSYVSHQGAVCRGVKDVITYDGVTGTPDHEVMTRRGWMALREASDRRERIAQTGHRGRAIRLSQDCFEENGRSEGPTTCRGGVPEMLESSHGALSQYQEKARNEGLPCMQWSQSRDCSEVAISEMSGPEVEMRESELWPIRSVWWSGNKIQISESEHCGPMDSGKSRHSQGQVDAIGSHRRERSLRAREFALGNRSLEYEQPRKAYSEDGFFCVQEEVSADKVCGYDSVKTPSEGTYGRTNHREICQKNRQEVWDILNAGPLQRFTANGRLVHNCVVLDHAGNHARLGLPTDIDKLITSLDTSKKGEKSGTELAKEAPKPKECPKCGALKPTGTRECPTCHFVPAKVSDIEEVDGKLIEMRELRARQDMFLGQLKHYAAAKGKSENYVIARYKQKFGSWPTRHVDPIPPTADFVKAMQGMNIRWAKGKGKKAA